MRLRPALMTCVIAALAIVSLRLTSIAYERDAAASNNTQRETVEGIARNAANLLALTQDYGLHQSARAVRQWGLSHQRLSQALIDYAANGADSAQDVDDLLDTARGLPQAFAALQLAAMREDAEASVRRETLTDQLINETRRVSDGAFDLSRDLAERRNLAVQRQLLLSVVTQLGLLAVILLLAGLLLRRVLSPIDRMHQVARAVQAGDLAARSALQGKDELGQLSQTLDAMTAALEQRDAALRESNRRLARNEAFLERAGQMTGVGGWELDLETGQMTWTAQTHAVMQAHGTHPDAQAVLRSFTPDSEQRLRQAMAIATQTGQGWDLELELRAPDGQMRWLHSVGAAEYHPDRPSEPEDGRQIVRLIGAVQDITDQRAAADILRQAIDAADAASAAKTEFLANMSHEIRTPMNAVMGLTYLLERTPLSTAQHDLLAKISGASHSLLDLINAVLDLSKIEAGEMVLEALPFDLHALLQEVAGLFQPQAQAKDLTLELDLGAGANAPLWLLGDACRLRQIVSNLLSNAIKFTAHGNVAVTLRCTRPETRPVHLEIAVQDSGIGIPAQALSHIFMPFTQADSSTSRRYGGTGLGLSIVRQLCHLMGGHITVSSSPGVGTRFLVNLALEPASNPAHTEAARPATSITASRTSPALNLLPGLRVLVADDSSINLEVVQRVLEGQGATVALAHNGAEAVLRLRTEPDAFDAVLMDLQMPVLDGLAATRIIRNELGLHRLPILALTAGALLSEQERALEAGMNGFVSKPFAPAGLVQLLRQHVQTAPRQPSPAVPFEPGPETGLPASGEPVESPWPELAGVDAHAAREQMGGDLHLFARLLGRLLDEFEDLAGPGAIGLAPDDVRTAPGDFDHHAGQGDPADLAQLAARLHKLGGSAGLVAAKALQEAALRGESQIRAGFSGRAEQATVAQRLTELAAGARPWLHQADIARRAAEPAATGPLDSDALEQLVRALHAHDLAALDQFEALTPALRATFNQGADQSIGDARFEQLRHALQRLDFDTALTDLAALAPVRPADGAPV